MDYEAFAERAKSAFDDCSEMKRMIWNAQSVVGAVPDMVRKNERLEKEKAELKAEIERLKSVLPGDYMDIDGEVAVVKGYQVSYAGDEIQFIAVTEGYHKTFTLFGKNHKHFKHDTKPADSWEQLEDDSLLSVDEYRNLTGIDCNEGAYFAKQRDLIRRAKRLAGVEDGED